jgi:hypothetical protein
MTLRSEQRANQRLKLRYPIRVHAEEADDATVLGRTVTQNVGARGAYFSTFDAERYRVGQPVSVVLSVPHRLAGGGPDVVLDLRGRGRVVRIEGPARHRMFGEDGATLTGIAIEFAESLVFQYRWVVQ